MKKTILLLALFAGGIAASFAVASPPPGRGPNRSTSGSTLTGQTGTNGKVTICHRTGSRTNPYVLITIDRAALPAHAAHGDVNPTNGTCPTTAGTTTATTQTTASTRTTTTSHGRGHHGHHGHKHGKSALHRKHG